MPPKVSSNDAVIAHIVRDGKVLLGLREYVKGKPVWTAPGGRCDEGETLQDTLKREVYEEIGVTDLKIGEYLGSREGAKAGDTLHIFKCDTDQEPRLMEPDKFLEWRWFKKTEVPENFISELAYQWLMNREF